MHKTSMVNSCDTIARNKPLPSLFQARASQLTLIFLSKIERQFLPLDQAAKKAKGLRRGTIKYMLKQETNRASALSPPRYFFLGNNRSYARGVRNIYLRPPKAPPKGIPTKTKI
jgi:hypothetical protein